MGNSRKIIAALHRVLSTGTFLKSGNLLLKLKDLGKDAAIELSDAYYNRIIKEKEVSEKAYLLGRLNRTKKPVYRIEYPPDVLFYIGTEADILRKITKYKEDQEGKEAKETKDKEKKELTTKDQIQEDTKDKGNQSIDLEVSDGDIAKIF